MDVWRYTFEHYGDRQAVRYLRMLDRAIERLIREPGLGTAYDVISSGLRRYSAERHRLFLRVDGEDVVIVRVLHEAQDVGQQPFDED